MFEKSPYQILQERERSPYGKIRTALTVAFFDTIRSSALYVDNEQSVANDIIENFLMEAFQIIKKYGGVLNQTAGDGMMAIFGLDDSGFGPLKACLALQEINQINAFLKIRGGIDYGEVLISKYVLFSDKAYQVSGTPANLACKLLGYCGDNGKILITQSVFSQIKAYYEPVYFQDVEYPERTACYVLDEQFSISYNRHNVYTKGFDSDDFVGRVSETAFVLKNLQSSICKKVCVIGSAGIGKTVFIKNLLNNIDLSQSILIEFSYISHIRTTADFIDHCLNLLKDKCKSVNIDSKSFTDDFPPNQKSIMKLFLEFFLEDKEHEIKVSKYGVYECLCFLQRLISVLSVQKKIIFVFEDLQWADQYFEAFIRAFKSVSNVKFLCSSRRALKNICFDTNIELQKFSEDEMQLYINKYGFDDVEAKDALDISKGHPYLIQVLLSTNNQHCSSINKVYQDIFNGLREDVRDTLCAAAMIGPKFDLRILCDDLGKDIDDILPVLSDLIEINFVEGVLHSPYAFKFSNRLLHRFVFDRMYVSDQKDSAGSSKNEFRQKSTKLAILKRHRHFIETSMFQ